MTTKIKPIDQLLQDAAIEVHYKWGKTIAGSMLSANQAQQVLYKIDKVNIDTFGRAHCGLTLTNSRDGYVIHSYDGREMSGFAKTPKEAMAASWVVMCGLRKLAEGKKVAA